VQMYVYPKNDMLASFMKASPEMWDTVKAACKQTRAIHPDQQCNLNTDAPLPANATAYEQWYKELREQIIKGSIEVGALDTDYNLTNAKLFYASRSEYYYQQTQAYHALPGSDKKLPMFFLGDSAGSTDWALGLSGGRGMLSATELAGSIVDLVRQGPGIWQGMERSPCCASAVLGSHRRGGVQ